MRKIIIIMTVLSVFIVSTANADDLALTKQQIEEKFNLPPEPDPELNNATIEGIDSNNNDIRDDIERSIAFKYYKDPVEMKLHNLKNINYSKLINAYKGNKIEEYDALNKEAGNITSCATYLGKNSVSKSEISNMTLNTIDRFKYAAYIDTALRRELGFIEHVQVKKSECEYLIK